VPAHGFGLSDEDVLRQRLEKLYWQVIASESDFQSTPSIDPSSLTRWRKRLGSARIKELFAETIEAANGPTLSRARASTRGC
jgi:transposase, IS5 family